MGDEEDTAGFQWSTDEQLSLERWWKKAAARRNAHEVSANSMGRMHKMVSFPAVLVSAVLSSVTFQPDSAPTFLAPALAVFVTITSSTQAFFGFERKSTGHRGVSRGFGNLQRDIEMTLIRQDVSFNSFLEKIGRTFNELLTDAPVLTAGGLSILNAEGRGEALPNPFDNIRPITNSTIT
jgi:hypothetical protein